MKPIMTTPDNRPTSRFHERCVQGRGVLVALLGVLVLSSWSFGAAAPDEVRTIRIGVEVNSPPLSSALADGVPVGFSPELLREMQATGLVEFKIVPGYWGEILRKFEAGELDALANVIITDERRKTMWYSLPHATLHGLTYTRPGDPPVTSTEQFAGKSMVMLNGTISQIDATNHQGWGARMVAEESWAKVLQRVENGELDFALLTRQLTFEQPDELGLHRDFVDDILYPFHIVVHPGDVKGLEQINAALAHVQNAGIHDRLHAKWLGPIEPHPIRMNDLRPYALPIAASVALFAVVLFWQRYNNVRLQRQTNALLLSEKRFKAIFDGSLVALWEEDFADVWTLIDTLKEHDLQNFSTYLENHEDFVVEAARAIKVLNVNEAAIVLFGADSKESLMGSVEKTFTDQALKTYRKTLVAMVEGAQVFSCEVKYHTLKGEVVDTLLSIAYPSDRHQSTRVILSIVDITERKQAERYLRESEERFHRASVNSPFPVMIHAEDGAIIQLSNSWCEITGYEREELKTIGDWTALAYGERKQPVLEEIESLYSLTGSKAEGEYTVRTKSGALRIWDFHSASLGKLPDGRRLAMSMAMDITDKKERERQVEIDRGFLKAVLESITEGIVACDASGVLTLFNRATREFHGLAQKSIPAEEWAENYDLFLPDGETPMKKKDVPLFRALNGEEVSDVEMVIVPKNGKPRRLLASGRLLSDTNGKKLGAVVSMNDITERKQSDIQLRKLSNIIDQAPISVLITDLAGSIEYANPKACQTTGYALDELIGQNPRIFKSGETPPEFYREMWETITLDKVWSGEFMNRRKDGEVYFETVLVTPIHTGEGKITHYAALKDDITVQRRNEVEAVEKLAKEKAMSDMKTRFISLTSHEFRTPMAAAMGSVEILANHLDRLSPAKRTELFGRINSSLNRMTVMLDEILTLNRIDSNRVEVNPTKIDLVLFLKDMLDGIRLGDRGDHSIEFVEESTAGSFVTDTNLLRHIVENLLSNAIRYSPTGSVITVHLIVDDTQLQLTVKDEGIGIPLADQARLFEPFERGSNVGTIKGTGLGLNVVKRMTGLLHGTIALDSPEGEGCCFTLIIPNIPVPVAS